jgi:tRNA threonylcarbamoyladenosine biosynthesis protein TsaE
MEQIYRMSEDDIDNVAKQILQDFPDDRFFAFWGSMGAGKTTLIKAICKELDVMDNVCSPTFAIVNEYQTQQGKTIYHFDFYRIKNLQEAFDIGYEEYFYSGNYCFVEWTEKIQDLLPESYVEVSIEEVPSGERIVSLKRIS